MNSNPPRRRAGAFTQVRGRRRAPDTPADLPSASWWGAIRRTPGEFRRDNLLDWAAALTYYAVLSIFPAMLVLVSVVGLLGRSFSQSLIANMGNMAPGPARQLLVGAFTELQRSRAGAGLMASLGLVGAVWSASGYVGAFMRASNVAYDVPEGRPIWKTVPIRLAVTVVTFVVMSATVVAVVMTGPLAYRVGDVLGLGGAGLTVWGLAKWPVLLLVVNAQFALLYWASPNARQGFRWVTPGGLVALLVWLITSGGFALYVSTFGASTKVYGSLGGLILFLVWLWLSNVAILVGAELNAELERGRAMSSGLPENAEPYVEPRDTRKLDDDSSPGR